jgi:hypothetical protein
MRTTLLSLCLVFASLPCIAQQSQDYFDDNTIRLSDVPKDAPDFNQYPARPMYNGPIAPPDVKSHPRSRLFRTMIRDGAKQRPNFAGHYTIVTWGCGAGCVSYAIVDAQTGKVFHPSNFQTTDNVNIDFDALESPDGRLVKFRPDSYLLIVIGGINEDPKRRGISYFTWQKNQLRRIRFVPRPYETSQ